jgi:hypothetical protein
MDMDLLKPVQTELQELQQELQDDRRHSAPSWPEKIHRFIAIKYRCLIIFFLLIMMTVQLASTLLSGACDGGDINLTAALEILLRAANMTNGILK